MLYHFLLLELQLLLSRKFLVFLELREGFFLLSLLFSQDRFEILHWLFVWLHTPSTLGMEIFTESLILVRNPSRFFSQLFGCII